MSLNRLEILMVAARTSTVLPIGQIFLTAVDIKCLKDREYMVLLFCLLFVGYNLYYNRPLTRAIFLLRLYVLTNNPDYCLLSFFNLNLPEEVFLAFHFRKFALQR